MHPMWVSSHDSASEFFVRYPWETEIFLGDLYEEKVWELIPNQ